MSTEEIQLPAQDQDKAVTASNKGKYRARLGETQIVEFSDDEDDEDLVGRDDDETAGDANDPDFLKNYPDDTQELHLQHLKIVNDTLALLRFPRFGKHLNRICLRQNNLTSPLPAGAFEGLEALRELDMYDNRLGSRVHDEELAGCTGLTTLDLSFNNIRHAPRLPSQKTISTLYLVQNKIAEVQEGDLDWSAGSMKSLELGGNRLRRIEHLEKLVLMEELWLGKNKIRMLENLDTFSYLKVLSIQSNRITKMEGLEGLVALEELYLSHNGLTKIEGLEKNGKLRVLDIGNNMIEKIENISHLTQLEEFWASYNKFADLRDLDSQLAVLPNLETVYLEGNPCHTNDRTGYRRKVILALPKIKQVDATYVRM